MENFLKISDIPYTPQKTILYNHTGYKTDW